MADTTGSSPTDNCMEKLRSYLKTQKGHILAAEIVLGLIILICYAASLYGGYIAVAISETIFAVIFFVIYMMELDKQFFISAYFVFQINWIWSDFFRALVGACIYIITSLICVFRGAGDGALIAGGVFGLIAGILYAYDTYTIYLQLRSPRRHMAPLTEPPNDGGGTAKPSHATTAQTETCRLGPRERAEEKTLEVQTLVVPVQVLLVTPTAVKVA